MIKKEISFQGLQKKNNMHLDNTLFSKARMGTFFILQMQENWIVIEFLTKEKVLNFYKNINQEILSENQLFCITLQEPQQLLPILNLFCLLQIELLLIILFKTLLKRKEKDMKKSQLKQNSQPKWTHMRDFTYVMELNRKNLKLRKQL